MKPMKRMLHFDFHTAAEIDDFGKNINPAEIAQMFKDANAEYINFFARCNKGFSYYPTKIGKKHPYLDFDLLGELIKECHARDIGITAYANGVLNHAVLIEHPEWCKQSKEGKEFVCDVEKDFHFFRQGCFNTPYREHLMAEIKEMLSYNPDGIFIDCLLPEKCYCPACRAKMAELGIDTDDDGAVFKYACDVLLELFAEIKSMIPEGKRLFLNSYPYEAISHFMTQAELECLPTDGWGYEYFLAQAPYYRNLSDDALYMSGCFVDGWGDLGGKKEMASVENDIYDALVFGYSPAVSDHMHPRDGLDKEFYKELGKRYAFVKELEKWTEGTRIFAEVGVIRNKVTHKNIDSKMEDGAGDRGVARMLTELKICFDVINEDLEFSKYKLLILPDNIEITEKLSEKLEKFEGAVISSGKSIASGGIWSYIDEYADDTNTHGFYKWGGKVYGMYDCGIRMKSKCSVSEHVEPYFNREYFNNDFHFYVPPKDSAGYSAVAKCGKYAHIAFNVFGAYLEHGVVFHKQLVNELIDDLMGERMIRTTLPSTSRVSLATGKNNVLHVKVTFPEIRGTRGIIEEHVTVPAGHTVEISGEYKKVSALPDLCGVSTEYKNGKTVITLPEITGYKAFLLE